MANGIFIAPGSSFCWNVDANVGIDCPNKTEDVQLVQLGYASAAANPLYPHPELKPLYAKVVPGAIYTGRPDDPLSIAIKAQQKAVGGPQDGRISMIHRDGHYAQGTFWMLCRLNKSIAVILAQEWPHLDRHPRCPATLRDASIRVLDGIKRRD